MGLPGGGCFLPRVRSGNGRYQHWAQSSAAQPCLRSKPWEREKQERQRNKKVRETGVGREEQRKKQRKRKELERGKKKEKKEKDRHGEKETWTALYRDLERDV